VIDPYATGAVATTAAGVAAQPQQAANLSFAEQGEAAFKAGDYQGAMQAWRHAILDDQKNPLLMMMLGQAFFATGNFQEAAGATQGAMDAMPKDQWGVVVAHAKELYGNMDDYTTQLRALETAIKNKPDDPAQRFLAGFHYGYLGYPQLAIDQLDRGIKNAPQDEAAKALREEMRAKLTGSTTPAAAPPAALTPANPM